MDQDVECFHALDYESHNALCVFADSEFVFETIVENKAQFDRICMLSLAQTATIVELIGDHKSIAHALIERNEAAVIEAITKHLSLLDDVVTGFENRALIISRTRSVNATNPSFSECGSGSVSGIWKPV